MCIRDSDIISALSNSKSIERLSISADFHSTNNYSSFDNLDEIKLALGRTLEDSVIEITLGDLQSLILDNISDGDSNKAVLNNGGIKINQLTSATEVDITINNVGSIGQNINNSLYLDLAGLNLQTTNFANSGDSSIIVGNSGAKMGTINLTGSGNLKLFSPETNPGLNICLLYTSPSPRDS